MSHLQSTSKVLISLIGILVSVSTAAQEAAEEPSKTIAKSPQGFVWTGPYLGVYGGGGWGQAHWKTNVGALTPTSYFSSIANINSVNHHGTGTRYPAAAIGGVKIGENWQFGKLLLGLQLDFGSFSFSSSKKASHVTYPTIPAQYSMRTSMSTNWLGAARGRLGFIPYCHWPLFYISLGGAATNLKVSNSFRDNTANLGVGGSSATVTKIGLITGAGVEIPIKANFTVNGEYQYVAFGSVATNTTNSITCQGGTCPSMVSPYATSTRLRTNNVTLGLNYKLK